MRSEVTNYIADNTLYVCHLLSRGVLGMDAILNVKLGMNPVEMSSGITEVLLPQGSVDESNRI